MRLRRKGGCGKPLAVKVAVPANNTSTQHFLGYKSTQDVNIFLGFRLLNFYDALLLYWRGGKSHYMFPHVSFYQHRIHPATNNWKRGWQSCWNFTFQWYKCANVKVHIGNRDHKCVLYISHFSTQALTKCCLHLIFCLPWTFWIMSLYANNIWQVCGEITPKKNLVAFLSGDHYKNIN